MRLRDCSLSGGNVSGVLSDRRVVGVDDRLRDVSLGDQGRIARLRFLREFERGLSLTDVRLCGNNRQPCCGAVRRGDAYGRSCRARVGLGLCRLGLSLGERRLRLSELRGKRARVEASQNLAALDLAVVIHVNRRDGSRRLRTDRNVVLRIDRSRSRHALNQRRLRDRFGDVRNC